jgi:hypothetical protein
VNPEVGVFYPAGEDSLIGETVSVLQIHQPGNQAGMRGWSAFVRGEEACPFPLEPGPVDQGGEPDQFMVPVDQLDQTRPQQVVLFSRPGAVLHGTENRRICAQFQPNPAIPKHPNRQF